MADDKNLSRPLNDKEKDAETGSKIFAEGINEPDQKSINSKDDSDTASMSDIDVVGFEDEEFCMKKNENNKSDPPIDLPATRKNKRKAIVPVQYYKSESSSENNDSSTDDEATNRTKRRTKAKYPRLNHTTVKEDIEAIPGPSNADPSLPGPSRSKNLPTEVEHLLRNRTYVSKLEHIPACPGPWHTDPAFSNSFFGSTYTGCSNACLLKRLRKALSDIKKGKSNGPSSYIKPLSAELVQVIEELCVKVPNKNPSKVPLLQKQKNIKGKGSKKKSVKRSYSEPTETQNLVVNSSDEKALEVKRTYNIDASSNLELKDENRPHVKDTKTSKIYFFETGDKIVFDAEIHHPPKDVLTDKQNNLEGETNRNSEFDVAEASKNENVKQKQGDPKEVIEISSDEEL